MRVRAVGAVGATGAVHGLTCTLHLFRTRVCWKMGVVHPGPGKLTGNAEPGTVTLKTSYDAGNDKAMNQFNQVVIIVVAVCRNGKAA